MKLHKEPEEDEKERLKEIHDAGNRAIRKQ